MLIKFKRKVERDMNWWLRSALFSLVTICSVFDHCKWTLAQTYCEDRPKILFYRRGQAALVSGGDINENNNHVVVSNVNKEFLACVSSRNVEWTYDGEGEPSKFQESSTVDIQKYDDGTISYCLTSQITFSNKQSDTEQSRHTGKYSCREIGNVSNTVSVYVFASRRNSPTFLQSRKTMTLPLGRGNLTTYSASVTYPVAATATGSDASNDNNALAATQVFVIPCVTTHPNVTVKLLKKEKNKFVTYNGGIILFDPKLGFLVNASKGNSADLSEFYGDYKCVSSAISRKVPSGSGEDSTNSKMEVDDFVFITIVKQKSFQVYPPIQEVYTAGMLNLTCESEEPVIMKEVLPNSAQDVYSYLDEDDYGRDRSDDIVETTERTEQKSHIANYMEVAPAPGRSGEIQCLTEKDGKVLHTWRYRIIRKRAEKLSGIKFNKREKSFTCKSKLGAPGRLSFISCRTPSECRINGVCLTKSENCRGYSNSTRAFCERKSHFCGKIFYKGGSGLIRCIGEGIDEIRGFTDEASADHTVRMGFGKLKASETALLKLAEISVKSSKESQLESLQKQQQQVQTESEKVEKAASTIYEGDQVNVTLQMGYYYFLYPVQWAVKFRNGSTAQIDPDSQYLQVEKLFRTVYASLTLPYTSATTFMKYNKNETSGGNTSAVPATPQQPSEIIALHALIPLRASVDPSWKTISLPLKVFGQKNVSQPVDTESDELLVEQVFHHVNSTPSTASSDDDETIPAEMAATASESENDDDDDDDEAEDQEPSSILKVSGGGSSEGNMSTNSTNEESTGQKETFSKIEDVYSLSNSSNDATVQKENDTTNSLTTNSAVQPVSVTESSSKLPETVTDVFAADESLNTTGNSEQSSLLLLGDKGVSASESTSLSVKSAEITPEHTPDATSRDTKTKESSDDAEWMIVEKNQADETLFLARSGLLFDDEDVITSSSENEGNNNQDEMSISDAVFATTEIPNLTNVANDENDNFHYNDNNSMNTPLSSSATENFRLVVETDAEEASTIASAILLEESH